jgi:hypothetical protein
MGLFGVSGRVRRGRRRAMTAVVMVAALGIAAVTVILVTGARRPAACPSATNLLGVVAGGAQQPRLCALGAPSRLIGEGRLDGVSWRVIVTPVRPWSVYEAAGFVFRLGTPVGKGGICIVEVASRLFGSVAYGCQSWEPAGLAGQFLLAGCGSGPIVLCYAGLERRVDHFVVVPAFGAELPVHSVPFLGVSFAAFAMPKGEQVGVMTAYDVRGRPVASTTSF